MEEGGKRKSVSDCCERLDQTLLTLKIGKAMSKECRLPLESGKDNKMDSSLEP